MEQTTMSVVTKIEQSRTFQSEGSSDAEILHRPSRVYDFSKRLFDIIVALFGIIVFAPVFLVTSICIKFHDGGSILHFREIAGHHGRRFFALKFRTMIPDADTYLARNPTLMRKYQENMKLENDPRVTRVGSF